ncbi:MAG: c-type cytochrome, partial [Verrucomicrobiales bacterium]|nr:c-type cytochrome [Verrucomicrobiales bacterium]
GSDAVTVFLDDADAGIRREAVRAIHDDDGIPSAWPAVAGLIDRGGWVAEAGMMRRVLNANLLLGTEEAADRLVKFASDGGRPEALRKEALECLAAWSTTPCLDRVQGFVRRLGDRIQDAGDRRIRERFDALASVAGRETLPLLIRIVLDRALPIDPAVFVGWMKDGVVSVAAKAQVLELLARRDPGRLAEVLPASLAAKEPELRSAAVRVLAAREPEAFVALVESRSASWTLGELQEALRLAGPLDLPRARAWIAKHVEDLEAGRLPKDLALDLLEAGARSPDAGLRDRVGALEAATRAAGVAGAGRWALEGGNAQRGREVFSSHPNGQCVRCHDAGGEGQQVGPVLAGVAGRSTPDQLVEALLDPSARIADGFATVAVELRNGEEIDGVRLSETDTELVLRPGLGGVRRIPRRDIVRQTTSKVSAMPAMGEVLTRREIRDLVAYLRTLK